MRHSPSSFRTSEQGVTIVSYVLLIGSIALTAVLSLSLLGSSTRDSLTEAGNGFEASPSTSDADEDAAGTDEDETTDENEDEDTGATTDGSGDSDGADGSGDAGDSGGSEAADGSDGSEDAGGSDGSDGSDGSEDAGDGTPANQSVTAGMFAQFSVTFEERDGVLTTGSVSSGDWRYRVTKDTGRRIHLEFTHPYRDEVVVKGWLNRKDVLKTRVIEDD